MVEGFQRVERTYLGATREVFVGGEGPVVVVIHEVPGLHPAVAAFGRRLVADGFQCWMPSLLGQPGRPYSNAYNASSLLRACISREFTVWGTGQNSPITRWLRALARDAHEATGQPVGAVGMCLTGGFALAMMVDPHLAAPVLSQPSLPVPVLPSQRRDLGIDDETLDRVRARCAQGACVLGLRFTGDPLVPEERFQRLRQELGDAFLAVEIDSSPGNPHGIGRLAHSVLSLDYDDAPDHPTRAAYDQVVAFLRQHLGVTGDPVGRGRVADPTN